MEPLAAERRCPYLAFVLGHNDEIALQVAALAIPSFDYILIADVHVETQWAAFTLMEM